MTPESNRNVLGKRVVCNGTALLLFFQISLKKRTAMKMEERGKKDARAHSAGITLRQN
jgi:hypothetical protein